MKKFYALTLLIVLALAGCAEQPLPNLPGDDSLNIDVDNTTPADDTDAIDSQTLAPDKESEVFTDDSAVATDYYTLEVVETALTPREWLDAQYQDYSGTWAWDFKDYIFGYGGTETYNGFFALRNEPGMYVEYVLVPKDGKLYVFRTETAMKLAVGAEGYVQEREPRVKEIVTKLADATTDTTTDATTEPTY